MGSCEKVELIRERSGDPLPVMIFVHLAGMAGPIYCRLDSNNSKLDISALEEQIGCWCKSGRLQQLAREGEVASEADAFYRIKYHTRQRDDSRKALVWISSVFLILIGLLLYRFLDRPFAPLFWDWVGFCLVIFMLSGILSIVVVMAGLNMRRSRHHCQVCSQFLAEFASQVP